jgi:hypothetical protein
MKNYDISITSKKVVLFLISLFMLGLTEAYAQIGPSPDATNTPNYGIYGSAPTPASTPFTCGTPTKVNIQNYPEVEGGTDITLPLNDYKNFNFYYTEDGNGFLSGGGYRVTYRNASDTNCYGQNIVTYSPNSDHTNGVQVRPFVLSGSFGNVTTPRGVHGIILAQIPGRGGQTVPLQNATVSVGDSPLFHDKEKTNGIGYFSVYYSSYSPGSFLPYDNVTDFKVSGMYMGCTYFYELDEYVIWTPGSDYILGAEFDMGTISIAGTGLGCAP